MAYGSENADPEGLAQIFRQIGAQNMSGDYSYKPDVAGVNAAAGQHVAQILYSMPGANEGMGGSARLSRMMQNSLPVLQQKQAALGNERRAAEQSKQAAMQRALQSYQNAQNTVMQNKGLQLDWDRFTQESRFKQAEYDAQNSFGWGDALGMVGGIAGTALGGPLGGALGSSLFGTAGKAAGG